MLSFADYNFSNPLFIYYARCFGFATTEFGQAIYFPRLPVLFNKMGDRTRFQSTPEMRFVLSVKG